MKLDDKGEMQQALLDKQRKFENDPKNLTAAYKYFRELNRN